MGGDGGCGGDCDDDGWVGGAGCWVCVGTVGMLPKYVCHCNGVRGLSTGAFRRRGGTRAGGSVECVVECEVEVGLMVVECEVDVMVVADGGDVVVVGH